MAVVPYDVRFALADIRRNVGLHPLTWPTILLLNLDGTVFPSDDVDDLGHVLTVQF